MILVTGASGFVGTALCRALDAIKRPYRPVSRTHSPGVMPIDMVGPDTEWCEALDGVDAIVHLAARVHVLNDRSANQAAAYRKTNVDGTLRLARQAAARGVRRFIFVSSVKVNGESTLPHTPFRAEDTPAPADPYGRSKLEAEMALRQLGLATGMDVVMIRPPLVYGPGVKANFRAMLAWVQAGVPLPLGSVRNKRSFVAVENLVDLMLLCIDHASAAGKTFLVSDGFDLSTPELLRALARSSGGTARLISVPVPLLRGAAILTGQRARVERLLDWLQVDIATTRSSLGWTPPLTVEEAFARSSERGW